MTLRRILICTFALALALPLVAEEKSPVSAGKWEITIQVEMPGLPVSVPPVKTTQCVTAEEAADPKKSVPTGAGMNARCQIKDMKVSGRTISYTIDCPDDKIKGEAEMTYKPDSFEGTMKMKIEDQDQEFTTKYSGKRLGDC